MILAVFADVLQHLRRVFFKLPAPLLFAIQKAEGVFFKPPFAIFAKIVKVLAVIVRKLLTVYGAAFFITQRVKFQLSRRADFLHKKARHSNHGRIGNRVPVSQYLKPHLPEFPKPAALGRFVAKVRAGVMEHDGLGPGLHALFKIGADDGNGALGAQGQLVSPARAKRVHLFFYNVGRLAQGRREQIGVFDVRRLDFLKSVIRRESVEGMADKIETSELLAEEIAGASRRSEQIFFHLSGHREVYS